MHHTPTNSFSDDLPHYDKPHCTYTEQLELLRTRGLICDDSEWAIQQLQIWGYYRLSAYVYPFRVLLPKDPQRRPTTRYRDEQIMDGVHFDHVIQLAKFDQKLRHKTLEGLEIIETGIKSQIAYIAGVESCFAHLEEASMEDGTPEEKWEKWKDRYDSLCKRAAEEDYYKHHIQKYSGELPIWIATEVLDFGGMCFLFEMLKKKTQSKISQNLNVKQGTMLSKWLLSLNHTRNRCAHFNRLWNRPLKRTIKAPRHGYVDDTLHHLHDVKETDKIYISLAVIAYLTRQIDPNTRWPIHLRELMKKFPQVPYLSAENDMGFPADWSQYALWKP